MYNISTYTNPPSARTQTQTNTTNTYIQTIIRYRCICSAARARPSRQTYTRPVPARRGRRANRARYVGVWWMVSMDVCVISGLLNYVCIYTNMLIYSYTHILTDNTTLSHCHRSTERGRESCPNGIPSCRSCCVHCGTRAAIMHTPPRGTLYWRRDCPGEYNMYKRV